LFTSTPRESSEQPLGRIQKSVGRFGPGVEPASERPLDVVEGSRRICGLVYRDPAPPVWNVVAVEQVRDQRVVVEVWAEMVLTDGR